MTGHQQVAVWWLHPERAFSGGGGLVWAGWGTGSLCEWLPLGSPKPSPRSPGRTNDIKRRANLSALVVFEVEQDQAPAKCPRRCPNMQARRLASSGHASPLVPIGPSSPHYTTVPLVARDRFHQGRTSAGGVRRCHVSFATSYGTFSSQAKAVNPSPQLPR
ncbi:hypothetical protein B0T25DRAFT_200576 [Lasiosphaeria hispida]|uniref:Uncharacterized protein n=1 Tax=Lasiosphaeria hispida TaxID=260671 RepID=A0AAJ0ME28_9PEZI|nr:hypothetical protein B0T25DRAFT_200576 [Lasiosphaeria hispida]